jgi:hypothetical protein
MSDKRTAKKKSKLFRELDGALKDAIGYEKGRAVNLRVVKFRSNPRRLNSK